jgi:hypothetical protein
MFKSKHSGWTWELKRTPFGGSGGTMGPIQQATSNVSSAVRKGGFNPNAPMTPQAPARDVVQERMQQRQQEQQQAQGVTPPVQQAPQQAAPVSPFVQQQRQQLMQQQMPQMRGIGAPQQPGLQSMLARILGYGGGGGGYMPQQMMPQQRMMPQQGYGQGMPPQGYGQQMGMPSYGRFAGNQNPLAYRPDMQAAQNNTGNVAIGVAEQQRRALQAQLDAANAQLSQQSGGGGE